MQTIILGSGSPLPDPRARRALDPGAHRLRGPALRLRARRPHAGGCCRVGRRSAAWRSFSPICTAITPPTSTTSSRRAGSPRSSRIRSPSSARSARRRSCRRPRPCWSSTSAIAWPITTICSGGRRRRSSNASAARCWRTVRSGSPRRPPIMRRFGRPWASASRRAAGRSSSPGDTVPCDGLDELCRGSRHARPHCRAPRPHPTDRPAPAPRRPRLPLLGRGRSADRGPQRRRHPRPDPPRARTPAGHRARMDGAGGRALRRHGDPGPRPSHPGRRSFR